MPRNTRLLVAFLALFAIVVAALNIYRWINPPEESNTEQKTLPSPTSVVQATPTPSIKLFSSFLCGITISYPGDFTISEDASGSAILASPNKSDGLLVSCSKEVKAPIANITKRENIELASTSAVLFSQDIDGHMLQTLVIRHPETNIEVLIAGAGQVFKDGISSIQFLP